MVRGGFMETQWKCGRVHILAAIAAALAAAALMTPEPEQSALTAWFFPGAPGASASPSARRVSGSAGYRELRGALLAQLDRLPVKEQDGSERPVVLSPTAIAGDYVGVVAPPLSGQTAQQQLEALDEMTAAPIEKLISLFPDLRESGDGTAADREVMARARVAALVALLELDGHRTRAARASGFEPREAVAGTGNSPPQ
ncbi:MAG: hypothetical protein HYV63_01575 [Candidatus Schekmanbacteria bacterium]|nr:hypothetical protein [Candidatus Schekmanbacteria bacterium]